MLCRWHPSGEASILPRRKFLRAPTISNSHPRTAAAHRLWWREPAAPEPTSQSAGETAKLDSLKLTDNGEKKAPGVEFTKPLDVKDPTIKVVKEGDGDRVKANQVADISIVAFNGKDGSTVEDTFAKDAKLELNDDLKSGSAVIYNAFVGAKVGSHLALAVPGKAASAQGGDAQPSQLLVIKILAAKDAPKVLDKPEGDAVTRRPACRP